MNFLKKSMIALSAALLMWSCSDDDESTNGSNATISLSNNIIQVDKNGGDANVTITSSDDWRLSGVCDWAHPSATSGKSGDVVTFTIDPNSMDAKRTATFKFFTGSTVVALQVESEVSYFMDLVSESNLSVSKEKNTVSVEIKTNIVDPTITYSDGGEKWVTFDRRIDFEGKTFFAFKTTINETYKERSTTITINSPHVAAPVNVSLTQERTDAIITESSMLMNDLAERTISFKVRYNVEYSITIPEGSEWITDQKVSEPQMGDDGLSTVTLSYKLSNASVTRGGVIRIAETDGSLTNEVTIVQKDPKTDLAEIPDNVFRSTCLSNKWILPVEGSKCIIKEAGLKATSFYYSAPSSSPQITDITGIENFPNLTSINIGYYDKMKKLDISKLHKVSSLSFKNYYASQCAEYNLGDNPITKFTAGGVYLYSDCENLKFISSKLEDLSVFIQLSYTKYDKVTSIDVSECPALKTLNANRSDKVKTLYLKTGQVIPNLTKNDETTIVYK